MTDLTPRGERFPRWIRLTRRKEFTRVLSGGRRCARRFLVLAAAPREDPGTPARLGLTVSRKVGNAVARNRVKRRLREIFRRRHAELPTGQDFVVIARPGAAGVPYTQLAAEFDKCLRRLFPDHAPNSPETSPKAN